MTLYSIGVFTFNPKKFLLSDVCKKNVVLPTVILLLMCHIVLCMYDSRSLVPEAYL